MFKRKIKGKPIYQVLLEVRHVGMQWLREGDSWSPGASVPKIGRVAGYPIVINVSQIKKVGELSPGIEEHIRDIMQEDILEKRKELRSLKEEIERLQGIIDRQVPYIQM